jgi:hypothetical protein
MSESNLGKTEITSDKVILWQDHSHPNRYRPTLKMLYFPDGKQALELNVFGNVLVIPYTKAECGHD